MSADKYPSIFSRQMEAIVYIIPENEKSSYFHYLLVPRKLNRPNLKEKYRSEIKELKMTCKCLKAVAFCLVAGASASLSQKMQTVLFLGGQSRSHSARRS